ncbi:MAG: PAS domain-containing protein [Blastocatellia bacterium]
MEKAEERQRSEEKAGLPEVLAERYRFLSARTSDIAWETRFLPDYGSRLEWVTQAMTRLLGYTEEEFAAPESWRNVMHPDDLPSLIESRQRLETGEVVEAEYRMLSRDGKVYWFHALMYPVLDDGGQVIGATGAARDVTRQKEAEHLLRESEARYRSLIEATPAITYVASLDPLGVTKYISPQVEAGLGFTPEEWMATPDIWVRQLHPDDREKVLAEFQESLRQGVPFVGVYRIFHRDGRLTWWRDHAAVVRDAENQPLFIQGVMLDVTERYVAEERMRQAEARFRAMVEHVPVVTYIADADETGQVHYISPQMEKMMGYPMAEWMEDRKLWPGLVHPDDLDRVVAELHESRGKQAPFTSEYRMVTRDGRTIWVRDHATIMRDETSGKLLILGVGQDITERRQMEEEIRAGRDRLKMLSHQLITTQENERRAIARELHDQIGQELTALKINMQNCQRRNQAPELEQLIRENTELTENLLRQLRDLSLDLRPSLLDDLGLVPALRWYTDRQSQRTGMRVQFIAPPYVARLAPEIETVCFRIAQEALTNVVRHAAATSATVELRQSDRETSLLIIDDGHGFDAGEKLLRAARGGSLGLLGMQERAQLAGGTLTFETASGQGTRVIATFPLDDARPTSKADAGGGE